MNKNYISTTSEWTFELIQEYDKAIGAIANHYHLETYPCQIEIISSEQMIDTYSAAGMPVGYFHWSFGKQFLELEQKYLRGYMGLAHEIVINSNPCIAYLLEDNTMTLQALVIAHACYGHNSFFKNNYLFKTWTNPNAIIDYLIFCKNYIRECEEKYGIEAVEELIDACHALMHYGVDRYKHPRKLSFYEEKLRQKKREEYLQSQVSELWNTIPKTSQKKIPLKKFPPEPEENILYFIEKNSPILESWQREIVRIVRKIAQYFYPQRQTKVMNEGWASFWHYTLLHDLYAEGRVDDNFMLEFLHSHTNVIYQPSFDEPGYYGINPYTLGFNMMMDIRRICENPTDEDKKWFPDLVNSDWIKSLDFAMRNFKDESFIAQYLSPKVIRDLKLFSLLDDDRQDELVISAIHDDEGYHKIRILLSQQYNLSIMEPNIQVYQVDLQGNRSLTLRHYQQNRNNLDDDTPAVMKHLQQLWGFNVSLETQAEDGSIKTVIQIPDPKITKSS